MKDFQGKYSDDYTAFCIGYLFKAQKIENVEMRDILIKELWLIYKTNHDKYLKSSAKVSL